MAEIGEEDVLPNLFQEPKDFYKPEPPPTTATHRMRSGEELQLRLVGHNPLWVQSHSRPCCSFLYPDILNCHPGPLSVERRPGECESSRGSCIRLDPGP